MMTVPAGNTTRDCADADDAAMNASARLDAAYLVSRLRRMTPPDWLIE
jgi:hypothetical protein